MLVALAAAAGVGLAGGSSGRVSTADATAPATTLAPTTTLATTTTVASTTTTTAPALSTLLPTSLRLWPHDLFSQGTVQSWPLLASSATFAADIVADYKWAYGSVGVDSMPIYTVPAHQREVRVTVAPGCQDFLKSTGSEIPIPNYVSLPGTSDNPLVIYQPAAGLDWELWRAKNNGNGTYSACWGGRIKLATSDGVFRRFYGLSATGISYLATTVTEEDVASGSIDHAIAMLVPNCNWFVYPANRGDCGSKPGQPFEGQWFRFPAALPMPSGLTPFAQMVFKAIQDYGAVVVDYAGAVVIEAEQTSDWAAEGHAGVDPITASWDHLPEYRVIADLPWSGLQAVQPPDPG